MKNLLFCFYLTTFVSLPGFGQQWTQNEIMTQLPLIYKVINIPLGDNKYHITTTIDTLPINHPLHSLTNKHALYLAYLTGSYSIIDHTKLFAPPLSFDQADKAFRSALANDTLLNRCFVEMAAHYLRGQGVTVQGVPLTPKPTITMPALLKKAVRFFERIEATPNQHVAWYLNLPTNPNYDRSHITHQPLIESFCHMAIMNWSFTPTWRELKYDQSFYEEVKSFNARTVFLVDKKDWREVVQPAMREVMTKSQELEKVLRAEYELSKDWVGFTLVD